MDYLWVYNVIYKHMLLDAFLNMVLFNSAEKD
jgi:hypothetical protein